MADVNETANAIVKLLVLREILSKCDSDKEPQKCTYVGLRVVRGPDWKWDNQDGGEGHLGTVTEISNTHEKTVAVQWDCGYRGWYRVGTDGAYDLRTVDNASVGVKHESVICDACRKETPFGIRWKCEECLDFDLCSPCYMADRHDVSHPFLRIGIADAPRVQVPKREGSTKIPMSGILNSALVVRGPDWTWNDQDGGNGKVGLVLNVNGWDDATERNSVVVLWLGQDSSNDPQSYRLGHTGKVDLKYVRHAVEGSYYRDHLPVLGDEMREVRFEESSSTVSTKPDRQKGLFFLSENMKKSFLSDKFSDFTFKVKYRVFPAHKFILCARSPVFESMLRDSGNSLDVTDCDPLVFEDLLYYVYTGTLKLTAHAHIDDLLNLAQRFNIQSLKAECRKVKNKSADKDSIWNFIAAA